MATALGAGILLDAIVVRAILVPPLTSVFRKTQTVGYPNPRGG
jgi:hypothetical protein